MLVQIVVEIKDQVLGNEWSRHRGVLINIHIQSDWNFKIKIDWFDQTIEIWKQREILYDTNQVGEMKEQW